MNEMESQIQTLSKRYLNYKKRLKENEYKISLKNKLFYLVFAVFLYSQISLIVYTYTLFENEFLQWLIGLPSIVIHYYVYIIFGDHYTCDDKKESEMLIQTIQEIKEELNLLLVNKEIDINEYYKKLES